AQHPREVIETFFEAFHQKDTTSLKNFFTIDSGLVSVQNTLSGIRTKKESVADFIQTIGAIPADLSFEERLLDFKVVDASVMTLVFTPYQFYINGSFSHCGTNVFTLIKKESQWKILALYDTRNKSCEFSNQTN
ncbi:MAG: nuclear transport factor 2 family protein, partial [Flavobacteriaceae bacterium]